MGAEQNFYSIESISDALLEAGSLAAQSRDETEIIHGHLKPMAEILQMNCAVFYAGESSPLAAISPVRVLCEGRHDLQPPQHIPVAMEGFIRGCTQHMVTSHDPVFSMGHLRALPVMSAASSAWSAVTVRGTHFGTVALFDQSYREFQKIETQLVGTFSMQLGHALESLHAQKMGAALADEAPSDLVRYIESAKLVGGISRDLINPLTAMMGYIELMKAGPGEERSRHYLLKLQEQTEKAQQIVKSIQASSPIPAMVCAPALTQKTLPPAQPKLSSVVKEAETPLVTVKKNGRMRVLIVQKSEAVLEFERAILSGMQAEVMATRTGNDAVELLGSHEVSAVLLDDEIDGDWHGGRLLYWIQEHKPALIQHVLMTVCSRPGQEIQSLIDSVGVPTVKKPIQMSDLFLGVQQILGPGGGGVMTMTSGNPGGLLH